MAKKAKPQTLAQLQKKWYGILKTKGFEDIEKNEYDLKFSSSYFTKKDKLVHGDGKEQYYYLATHFLNDHKFSSKLEQIIWEYHSEGISFRNISKVLEQTKVASKSKDQISFIIKRLRKIMFEIYGVVDIPNEQ